MAGKTALIVVDMQNDFCPPNGSLAVEGAKDTLPLINSLLSSPKFALKAATQDYHPKDHISFASNHDPPDNKPFETYIDMPNLVANKPDETMKQLLWPDHCIQGSEGAAFVPGLANDKIDVVIRKGMDSRVEMYSAFADSFGNLTAGCGGVSEDLAQLFRDKGIEDVIVVGVAGDYCVKFTALDAAKAGFSVSVVEEGQRCVDSAAWEDVKQTFAEAGVQVVHADGQAVQDIFRV